MILFYVNLLKYLKVRKLVICLLKQCMRNIFSSISKVVTFYVQFNVMYSTKWVIQLLNVYCMVCVTFCVKLQVIYGINMSTLLVKLVFCMCNFLCSIARHVSINMSNLLVEFVYYMCNLFCSIGTDAILKMSNT